MCEWGLGDMMQFIRYARLIKSYGATITVQTFKPLIPLFKLCPFLDDIISFDDYQPFATIRIPMLSLPMIFDTTLQTIPTDIPYLQADKQLTQQWQQTLANDKNFKIGICWHAKPIYLEDHKHTRRSIPLTDFIPLSFVPGISFYNLQKIHGTDELNDLPYYFKVHDFGDALDTQNGNFMDSAALIKNLDLVISADTSIVHLAGALGVPTWVALPYTAEWRWLQNRSDTPWYPTVQLFRQTIPGDWSTVIQEIKDKLQATVREHS